MVSGASAIGAHLAFVNSVEPEMIGHFWEASYWEDSLQWGLLVLLEKINKRFFL